MSHFLIIDNDLIRYDMTAAFQKIFNKQPDLHNTSQHITDYLNSDGETKPLEELNKKKNQSQQSTTNGKSPDTWRITQRTFQSY